MGSSASKIFSEQFGNKELEKNFKHMKSLLDEIIVEILDAAVPSIKLVDFQLFKTFDSFPSYKHLVHVNELRSAELMNRDESFVVYISHAWSRLSDSSSNWEGYAQPDTVDNEKFRLCVIGIERACSAYAEGMKQCYIWLDYSCVSENSGFEYRRLDNLMEMSDCIFTPIFDSDIIYRYKNHKDTKPYKLIRNYFDEYPASNWNEGPNAYLNVGWCRLEMYCAATIPLPGRNDSDTQNSTKSRSGKEKTTRGPLRIDNFSGNFKIHVSNGRRPHILFGNYEELARQPPFILPSFHNKYNYYQTYFDRYVPCEGTVSSDAERAFMELWTAKVIPYIHSIETAATDALKDGYEGERNEAGEYEGEGSFRYLESGDIYEGQVLLYCRYYFEYSRDLVPFNLFFQWKRGRKHGYGVYKSAADGVIYKGNWKADLRHGIDVAIHSNH